MLIVACQSSRANSIINPFFLSLTLVPLPFSLSHPRHTPFLSHPRPTPSLSHPRHTPFLSLSPSSHSLSLSLTLITLPFSLSHPCHTPFLSLSLSPSSHSLSLSLTLVPLPSSLTLVPLPFSQALQAPACHENMIKVGGYILGEFGNLIAGDPRSRSVVQLAEYIQL